jgi:hypothetical protein
MQVVGHLVVAVVAQAVLTETVRLAVTGLTVVVVVVVSDFHTETVAVSLSRVLRMPW